MFQGAPGGAGGDAGRPAARPAALACRWRRVAPALDGPAAPHVRPPPHHPAHQRPTAQAEAVAAVVTPLIADALALERQLAACDRRAARAPFGSFAAQMRASAALLAARVREVGGRPHTRDSDAAADGAPAAPRAAADGAAVAPPARARPREAVRQLLAHEDEVAGRLRQAIAACDARADERTASCLEEVLDEVEWQRSVLRALVPPAAPRPGASPTP